MRRFFRSKTRGSQDRPQTPRSASRAAWGLLAVVVVGLLAGFALGRSSFLGDLVPGPKAGSDWRYTLPELSDDVAQEYRAMFDDTRSTVGEVMQRWPENVDAVSALGLLHYLAHDPKGETRCWERCLELEPTHDLAFSRLVSLAEQDANHERMVEVMRRALVIAPSHSHYRGRLAFALFHLGRYDEVREVLEEYHRIATGTAETYMLLGRAYEQLKQLEKAQLCLETAVGLDPRRTDALYSLSTVCGKLGESERASQYRAQFDALKKTQLAQESKMGGRDTMADERFLPLRVAEILRLAGRACIEQDNVELAERCLVQAAEAAPTDTESRRTLATLYEVLGRMEDALKSIQELGRLEPENFEHTKNEAVLYVRLDRFDDAERVFQELCQRAPQRGVGYAGLAELYLRGGRKLDQARLLAEKSVRLEPTGWNCAVLAALAERAGDRATARTALEQAMTLEPQDPKYRQMYESLDQRK